YLQNAFGQLRLHVIGSTISAVIQVPLIFYAAFNYGAEGAGVAWFVFRVIWFFIWTPVIHMKFVAGYHFDWFFKEILPIIIVTVVTTLNIKYFVFLDLGENRFVLFVKIFVLGMIVLVASLISS